MRRSSRSAVPARDPFDRIVDEICRGTDAPIWTGGPAQLPLPRRPDLRSRRVAKALYEYWGAGADRVRVDLALEDSRFVTGVVQTVCDALQCSPDDRRRIAAAATRSRLLGESDATLAPIDAAWRAWWPPDTSPQSRARFEEFVRTWRAWLQDSAQ